MTQAQTHNGAWDLERLAGQVPLAIILFFAFQLTSRLLLSSNLEIDETQFVGALHWAWGYGDSQPPLYNWLVILVVGTLRYWPAIAAIKYALLTATFLLVYDTGRRTSGSRATGAVAALSLAFVYQIIWQSQVTLAQSVLSLAAVAASLHALVLIWSKGRLRDFVWLGCALGAGLLSKYNFTLFIVSLLCALASIAELRRAFWRPASLLAIGITLAITLPHLLWAADHVAVTTARLARLDEGSLFSRFLPRLRGADGLFSLAWAVASAVLPMVVLRAVVRTRFEHDRSVEGAAPTHDAFSSPIRQLCIRVVVIGTALWALVVIVRDLHSVPERYLTPFVLPFSLWLSLSQPFKTPRAARAYGLVAMLVAFAGAIILPLPALFSTHAYAFPYRKMATEIATRAQPPFAILATRRIDAANLAIRLPGSEVFTAETKPARVLLLWTEREEGPTPFVPPELAVNYSPAGAIMTLQHHYAFFSGREARRFAQEWRRTR